MTAKKHQRWLAHELEQWLAEGLVNNDQAAQIRARYDLSAQPLPWARIIFSSLGAILIGLGLILFFAYNWQLMHKFAKLAIVLIALISVHGLALWYGRDNSRYPALGEGLHVLGTVFFGAGIWLIAQIYHIDEHYPTAFLIWGLGALALAWVLPSAVHGIIASILLVIWHGNEAFEFDNANHIAWLLFVGGLLPLAYWLRSQPLVFIVLGSLYFVLFSTIVPVNDELLLPVLMCFSTSLLALRLLLPQSTSLLSLFGYLGYFGLLYVLSFADILNQLFELELPTITDKLYFTVFALPALGLWLCALFSLIRNHQVTRAVSQWFEDSLVFISLILLLIISVSAALIPASYLHYSLTWPAIILFNAALFVHGCLFIINGSWQRNAIKTAVGCLLVALIVVSRYIDLFDSLLLRSLAFFIVGAIIFAVGNFYARHKPKATEPSGAP